MASDFKNTKKYLEGYSASLEREMRTRLVNQGKVASGKLFDSIRVEFKETPQGFEMKSKMADYGVYVDKGVKPHPEYLKGKGTGKSKMIPALMKWCQIQGLPKEAAYPIRRHIWKFGIKPTNFFTVTVKRREKELSKGIEKAMAKDFEDILKKGFK